MAEPPRLIKKYPNRRLYDTRTSAYITLADVRDLVVKHEEFQVVDAKSGDDLTRSILLQIILEEEAGGQPMFSSDVLTQFIRFYGNAMQGMMGAYLDRNVQLFNELQKRMQEQASQMGGGGGGKANQDLWNQFLSFQGPAMQGLISAYMDQSRNMFLQMQQLQNQTRNMFAGFPFPGFGMPGQGTPPAGTSDMPAQPESGEPDKK